MCPVFPMRSTTAFGPCPDIRHRQRNDAILSNQLRTEWRPEIAH